MEINLPPRVRSGLYVITAIGTPVIGYLFDKGIVSTTEVSLWASLVTAVSALAAFNVPITKEK